MKLEEIFIEAYRSISNQKILLDFDCKGFIGLNESGKSNILNAIRALENPNQRTKGKIAIKTKFKRNANKAGVGNKLVIIFVRHHDYYILTNNFSPICQIRDFGSGQILQPRQIRLSPGFAKIALWRLARRDSFSAKVPGPVSADGATNVYSLNRRAVRLSNN